MGVYSRRQSVHDESENEKNILPGVELANWHFPNLLTK
ncbi:hypothetical protein DESA109040_17735 [Deinococcus saxicola]